MRSRMGFHLAGSRCIVLLVGGREHGREVDVMTMGPTVRRRRLGSELRKLRDANGLKLEEVAGELAAAPANLSRLENGNAPNKSADLSKMLGMYGINHQQQPQVLVDMAREGP